MLSSVIVLVSGQWLLVATRPYRRSRDGHPLWIAGLPTPDSWRPLRQATYPQLLHHQPGRDLVPLGDQRSTMGDERITRNPMLMYLKLGSYLKRAAHRPKSRCLSQEPPRITRGSKLSARGSVS
jgi:hypothetical protein